MFDDIIKKFYEIDKTNCLRDENIKLYKFLNELSESISNNSITEPNLKLVGEFYMLYTSPKQTGNDNSIHTEQEMIKFLTLGWYVYCNILVNEKNL